MTTVKKFGLMVCAAVGAATAAFAAWQPGLQWGSISASSFNTTAFPAVTNYSLTIDKAKVGSWPVNTMYIYWGQIYLDGSAYRFGESIDDEAMLKINGTTVFDNRVWNGASFGTVNLPAGWYSFELRMRNASSGGGPNAYGGFSATKGFGYAKGTKAEMDALSSGATFEIPADPGNLTFLRYDDGLGFEDAIYVIGEPAAYGEVSPAYGSNGGYNNGQAVTFKVPKVYVSDDGLMRAFCTGATVSELDADTSAETMLDPITVSDMTVDGDYYTYAYTHGTKMCKVVWHWDVEYKVSLTSANGASLVSSTESWVKAGDSFTVEAGDGFFYWSGEVPDNVNIFDSSFSVSVDAPVSLTANGASTTLYVAPTATGAMDGSSWENALGGVQAALDAVGTTEGALICLKEGTYSVSATIANASTTAGPIIIRGGFSGDGFTRGGESVVARDASAKVKVFSFNSCSVAFDSLTVSNGYFIASSEDYGKGAGFISCPYVALFNSRFVKNGNPDNKDGIYNYGGAVGVKSGNLLVDGCTFDGNYIGDGGNNSKRHGGAIGVYGASYVRIMGSSFNNNRLADVHNRDVGGGAISVRYCDLTEIIGCTFTTNYVRNASGANIYGGSGNQYHHGEWGGTLYAIGNSDDRIVLRDSNIFGSWSNTKEDSDARNYFDRGGSIYFAGLTAEMERVAIVGAGDSGYTAGQNCQICAHGSITAKKATLTLKNVLHADARSGWCLSNDGSTVNAENCTFVGAKGEGWYKGVAYNQHQQSGGTAKASFKNCIFWNNRHGDTWIYAGAEPTFENCITMQLKPGKGNSCKDPLFSDDGFYHTLSPVGYYAGGYFTGGEWKVDSSAPYSPAVDGGALASDLGDEPDGANGGVINIGYDGGMSVASKSPVLDFSKSPVISYDGDAPITAVSRNKAHLYLAADENTPAERVVAKVWPSDGEESAAVEYAYGRAVLAGETFRIVLDGLAAGETYTVKVIAANGDNTTSLDTKSVTMPSEADALYLYVSPYGLGRADGSTATNAANYSELTAELACGVLSAGDELRFLAGVYTNRVEAIITGAAGLTLSGGWLADGSRGEAVDENETILTSTPDASMRIFSLRDGVYTFDRVSFTSGRKANRSTGYSDRTGALINAKETTLTFKDCSFYDNTISGSVLANGTEWYGGIVYQNGGSLTVDGLIAKNNIFDLSNGSSGGTIYGGVFSLNNVNTRITDSLFEKNYAKTKHYYLQGTAIRAVGGGTLFVDNTTFATNYCASGDSYNDARSLGGTIYANGLTSVEIDNSYFSGSWLASDMNWIGSGGTIYLDGASQKAVIRKSVFKNNGSTGNKYRTGSISVNNGTLAMTNVLISATYGNGVEVVSGTLDLYRCTITDCFNDNCGAAVAQSAGYYAVSDSILWNNKGKDVFLASTENGRIDSSFIEEEATVGFENTVGVDPLFADSTWYHVKSKAGNYIGGYFGKGTWQASDATSKTIDAATAEADYAGEAQPHGLVANIGYDAGLDVASKSELDSDPVVVEGELKVLSLSPAKIGTSSAVVRGEVAETAATSGNVTVTLYWDTSDKGMAGEWSNSHTFDGSVAKWDVLSYEITDVSGETYYRYAVTDANGTTDWSDPSRSFVCVQAPTFSGNVADSHLERTSVQINFTIASTGGADTTATLIYWPKGDEAAAVTIVHSDGTPLDAGIYSFELAGLTVGTEYEWRLDLTNSGATTTQTGSFATISTAAIVRYVSSDGAGIKDGSSWDNAFSSLQMAIEVCKEEGDIIYLKEGVYNKGLDVLGEYSEFLIEGAKGLTISGGYEGVGAPGERSGETKVTRNTEIADLHRVFRVDNSVVTFEHLTISGGRLNGGRDGHGLNLGSTSATTIKNCVIANNGHTACGTSAYGGGIYVNGGTLSVMGSVITNNYLIDWGDNRSTYGGAINSESTTLKIEKSTIADNRVVSMYHDNQGGALRIIGGTAEITDSLFQTNRVVKQVNHDTTRGYGGTIYASGVSSFLLEDSEIIGSYTVGRKTQGGFIFLTGSKQKTVINRCKLIDGGKIVTADKGYNNSAGTINKENIYIDSGYLYMTNVLKATTGVGNNIDCNGGTVDVQSSTIVNAAAYGVYLTKGTLSINNSILWGNGTAGYGTSAGTMTMTYTDTQDGTAGEGNISADPRFVNAVNNDYQLGPYSAARNSGNSEGFLRKVDKDLNGNIRVVGKEIDMGCYESQRNPTIMKLQ